jgi:phosphoribosylformimino-5-aminoimidazole carboxamide ribonucleotide (ProFAR) isomerase
MSDADIVSVFSRKMGAVERLMQRTHSDVQVAGGSEMKELHARVADLAAQIKREKYIEQLEAIESSTRSPLKVGGGQRA